jgi:hypothetical protein
MPEKARHVPLRDATWRAGEAVRAIEEIVSDALVHFDSERFVGYDDGHHILPNQVVQRDQPTSFFFYPNACVTRSEHNNFSQNQSLGSGEFGGSKNLISHTPRFLRFS